MGFVEQGGGGHSGERKPFCAFLFKFSFQSFQVYKCGYKSSGKQAKEINLLALYASSRGLCRVKITIGHHGHITLQSTHQPQSK